MHLLSCDVKVALCLLQGINRLCFSLVEKYQFGSVSEDGGVCVWSVESQRLLNKYSSPHSSKSFTVVFEHSVGNFLACGCQY